MTFLSGFLLLLSVGNTVSRSRFHPHWNTPFFNIREPLDKYTKTAKYGNEYLKGFKDTSNLNFFSSYSVGASYRVLSPQLCYEVCKQTKGCTVFTWVTGRDYGRGCYMFSGDEDNLLAEIAPIHSVNVSCPASKKGCVKRDFGYEDYRISIKQHILRKHYPYKGGNGIAGCQEHCRNYSGNNGFRFEHIDWQKSDTRLQQKYPNGIVPCGEVTLMYLYAFSAFCLRYAPGAPQTEVIKISGPTDTRRKEEAAALQNAINEPNFHNVTGHVLDMVKSVAHLVKIINPKECQAACQARNDCGKFQVIIGLPSYAGCHLFKRDAVFKQITVMSGETSCPPGSSNCAQGVVTKDVTYGETYEMIPRQGHQFTGSGMKACQNFCKAKSGENNGFKWWHLDWTKTGWALYQDASKRYGCSSWTHIDDPVKGKECRIFAEGSRLYQIHYRSGTELPSVNAKAKLL